jgi:formylglycine-generating enzyme required for sulfatase activity
VAFCLWLCDLTGEKIMLPTVDQSQYAAQGDDGRDYPWGNEWDCEKCNNSVKPCDSNGTTPVRQYEGRGDSPFGVSDMVGNVGEWCLTEYDGDGLTKYGDGTNDFTRDAHLCVVRGGSWNTEDIKQMRCTYHGGIDSRFGYSSWGFRLARS